MEEPVDIPSKAFVRLLVDALKEYKEEQDSKKREEKLARILNNLEKLLED